MTKKAYILILPAFILMAGSSCVSKKKFLEMQSFRQKADAKVQELTGLVADKNQRIEKMNADFEQMKNELIESNAIKDQAIDSLSGVVNKLDKTVNAKESAIGQKESSFSFEKQQLVNDLTQQKMLVAEKQAEIDQLNGELKNLKDQITQQTFDMNRTRDEKNTLQGNLDSSSKQITDLNATIGKLKTEIDNLKKQIADKNETINRLQNNVKLLKEQMK